MWAIIVMLSICIILGLSVYYYCRRIAPGKIYYVGNTYTEPKTEPFTNYLFKTRAGKKDHTYFYTITKLTESVNGVPAGTILLFDELKEPEEGSLCLFKHDGKMRIGRCISTGKLRNEPDLFDGHETPGIGYELIGVARYAA